MRTAKTRSRTVIAACSAVVICLGLSGALALRARAQQDTREDTQVAPGLTLTSCIRQLPDGPLRFWVVTGSRQAGWKLGLEVADDKDVVKKRSVRTIAGRTGAPVVVNGGFFAYGGAAVGAVKQDGDWYRMPWKNRTAIGWDEKGQRAMDGLQGTVSVKLGDLKLDGVTLNGLGQAYSYAKDNAFSVLTPHAGATANLRADQVALGISGGKVVATYPPAAAQEPVPPAPRIDLGVVAAPDAGAPPAPPLVPPVPQTVKVPIPADGWLLVCLSADRAPNLNVPLGTKAIYHCNLQPSGWAKWPYILGAGPRLVADSQVKTTEKEEEFRPDVLARGPRSAVGWDTDGDWMIMVVDGRQPTSIGLTIPETGALFKEFGAVQAMNLDGGSSTQLAINGQLMNNPSAFDPANPLRPREVQVSNALVIRQ